MSVDILGTSWDQCRSMVQYSVTSTETRRLVRTDSPGRPPPLSHSSWTMTFHYPVRRPRRQTKNKKGRHKNCAIIIIILCVCVCVWRNDVGDFRLVDWLEFAQHVLRSKYPKNERNKIRLTLASNRGSLGVLWLNLFRLRCGSVLGIYWPTKTRRQAHRHTPVTSLTLTLARSTHTRFAPSAYKTYAFAQRHKFDKNIPVNLAKTATAALPFLYSKCSV